MEATAASRGSSLSSLLDRRAAATSRRSAIFHLPIRQTPPAAAVTADGARSLPSVVSRLTAHPFPLPGTVRDITRPFRVLQYHPTRGPLGVARGEG
jgi:hypothetical protein